MMSIHLSNWVIPVLIVVLCALAVTWLLMTARISRDVRGGTHPLDPTPEIPANPRVRDPWAHDFYLPRRNVGMMFLFCAAALVGLLILR
ncbi:hypothetical protein [Ornithinimicrobium murale]|uniref:hypothetical protein n=1 Tax=Ornithinimicrobium murale TaxID=1050153 RepID=UPI000E0DF6C3|nr:hypothetical protein [Ornithinimicrobium murale]